VERTLNQREVNIYCSPPGGIGGAAPPDLHRLLALPSLAPTCLCSVLAKGVVLFDLSSLPHLCVAAICSEGAGTDPLACHSHVALAHGARHQTASRSNDNTAVSDPIPRISF
jgi:hypothetical protein